MHMSDALLSPAVGGVTLAASVGLGAYAIRKLEADTDQKKVALMGVMGAFVFAAQMINFSIPGTGSSGHLGGGVLLAILLGPYAGFLTMAVVLLIQALFFADGGLLAYGANVFNLGFYTCFVTYPLIYGWITRRGLTSGRIFWASLLAAVIGLQLGAFSVVLQTLLSGKTELPFATFLLLMQPIHLAIGIVEGLVTAAVVTFVWRMRPEILEITLAGRPLESIPVRRVLVGLALASVLVGGVLSWFASSNPDGLEWAMERTAGTAELDAPEGIHTTLAEVQSRTAFLPDYSFGSAAEEGAAEEGAAEEGAAWPAVDAGTTVSGLVGGALTLAFAGLIGGVAILFRRRKRGATA